MILAQPFIVFSANPFFAAMKVAMKAVTVKSITKTAIADEIAAKTELKRKQCIAMLQCLSELATREVKKTGKFTIPGVAMLKTRRKPATKAGKREMFGEVKMVKAKSAKTIVKAFPVAAIKNAL